MDNINRIELKGKKEIVFKAVGLNLEVKPYWLIKEVIGKSSQEILDVMIWAYFKKLLNKFDAWQINRDKNIKDSDDPDVEWMRYNREIHVEEIQDIADFTRELLDLHSDWGEHAQLMMRKL